MAIDAAYQPRNPEDNPLYGVVARHLETFLARQRERDRHVPGFVEREFREFLDCGALARGFIFASLIRRASEFGALQKAQCGAVTFIQRFGWP